jgi:hypothetical protein
MVVVLRIVLAPVEEEVAPMFPAQLALSLETPTQLWLVRAVRLEPVLLQAEIPPSPLPP